jgi:hypothetical protein
VGGSEWRMKRGCLKGEVWDWRMGEVEIGGYFMWVLEEILGAFLKFFGKFFKKIFKIFTILVKFLRFSVKFLKF